MASSRAGKRKWTDANEDDKSRSQSKSSNSKQLLISDTGSCASNKHANTKFVVENVKGSVTEQKRQIPSFDERSVEDIARAIGNAMISVEQGVLKEVKGDEKKDSFQTRLQPGFEKMLELCFPAGDLSAEVQQGSHTSTNVGNFTKCAITSQLDISIVLKRDTKAAVCGVCEVKVDKNYDENTKNHLFVELVTKQRSTQKTNDGKWLLIGLVVTEKRAYMAELQTDTWWGYLAEIKSIDRYDFDATDNLGRGYQMLAVIREYLKRLFTNFCVDQLFCATHDLAYFAYPSTADIYRFSAPHIVRCRFGTVRKYLATETCDWSNECGMDDEVVVKVTSNALYNNNERRLSEFLKDLILTQDRLRCLELSGNATSDSVNATASGSGSGDTMPVKEATQPSDYIYSMVSNHVWIGSCASNVNEKVCITRWLGKRVCRSPEALSKWALKETRQAFFGHVCAPALGAIRFKCYHGDIRLPNIVVQELSGTFQFSLVDWDEMVSITKDRGVKSDRRYPIKSTGEQQDIWLTRPSEWALLFTACQLYICATIISMVATVTEPEAEALQLERKWEEEVHFWEQSCPTNPIHKTDACGTNGLSVLRSLMKTPPDEHLSGKLSKLLMQVLNI